MAVVADTFFGGTIGLGTSTVLSLDILSGGRSAVTVADIETTYSGTSGDNKTYIPGDLVEGGTYDFEVLFDPNDDIDNLVGSNSFAGDVEVVTLTYPIPNGKTAAATRVFNGYINSFSEDLPLEDKMTASISIKVASDPTLTAAT